MWPGLCGGGGHSRERLARSIRDAGRPVGPTLLGVLEQLPLPAKLEGLRLVADHDPLALHGRWADLLADRSPAVVALALDLVARLGTRAELDLLASRPLPAGPEWLASRWDETIRRLRERVGGPRP